MCPTPSQGNPAPKQPSLLPSEHQPHSVEPRGSKAGGWWALALPLPTSPRPHRQFLPRRGLEIHTTPMPTMATGCASGT